MVSGNKLIIFIGSLFYPIYFLPLAFQYVIKNEKVWILYDLFIYGDAGVYNDSL